MKKLISAVLVLIAGTAMASAQDFATAAATAKAANDTLSKGYYKEAVEGFTKAAQEAAQCTGEEAAELLNNCRQGISQSLFMAANKLVKDGQLDEAIEGLGKAAAAAKEYGIEEIEIKANNLKQQVVKLYANNQIKAAAVANSAEEKIACYNKAIEKLDLLIAEGIADAKLYLQKGQVLKSIGKKVEAIECFTKAKDMGEEAAANKQIAKLYLQDANSQLSSKKYEGALESALKAIEYEENATAYKIAGTAANALKKVEDAVNYLNKYLELAPDAKDAAQIKSAVAALSAQIKK